MKTISGSRQRTAADDQLFVPRVPSLLTRLLEYRLRINGIAEMVAVDQLRQFLRTSDELQRT